MLPAKNISSEKITRLILANDSRLNEAINLGDVNKAVGLANTVLQAILQDSTIDKSRKTEVNAFRLPSRN